MKPLVQSFPMSCGSDSVLAHPQRLWSDSSSSSYRPYRFLSVAVIAARLVPRLKGPLNQISTNALNQTVARYSDGHSTPLVKPEVQMRFGHAVDHAADGCSRVKDPA